MKKKTITPKPLFELMERMENLKDANTCVEILHEIFKMGYLEEIHFAVSKVFEKFQHEETWDAAIQSYIENGNNIVIATRDFETYWDNRNAPISEEIDQMELPEDKLRKL